MAPFAAIRRQIHGEAKGSGCIFAAMHAVRQLSLLQFRNHPLAHFSFGKKITGICGPNGSGKTNLLDAVYFLCFTRSYFAAADQQLVTHSHKGMRLQGQFEGHEPTEVVAILRETGRKEFMVNGEAYPRMSRHLGRLPVVMVAPDDTELITGSSEGRRKWLDSLISQTDTGYLDHLIQYNKLLQQRNSVLRQMNEGLAGAESLLDILTAQLAAPALAIIQRRRQVLQTLLADAQAHYEKIADAGEEVALSWQSCLPAEQPASPEWLLQQWQQSRQKDLALQRTTWGPHRDDLVLLMAAIPFKQTASQGQRKSMLFALKLTEFEWLQQHKGFAPILLLDDVFEKLDAGRMQNLLEEVCLEKNGQVLITDTHRHRLEDHLKALGTDYDIIDLELLLPPK